MPLYHAKTNERLRVGEMLKDKTGKERQISRISEGTHFGTGIYLHGLEERFLPSELGCFTSSEDVENWDGRKAQ